MEKLKPNKNEAQKNNELMREIKKLKDENKRLEADKTRSDEQYESKLDRARQLSSLEEQLKFQKLKSSSYDKIEKIQQILGTWFDE
jgi:hypothetical protein